MPTSTTVVGTNGPSPTTGDHTLIHRTLGVVALFVFSLFQNQNEDTRTKGLQRDLKSLFFIANAWFVLNLGIKVVFYFRGGALIKLARSRKCTMPAVNTRGLGWLPDVPSLKDYTGK